MSKRPFVIFCVFAGICVLALPIWALARKGDQQASPIEVASKYKTGQDLFQINCGACHTLQAGGTDGKVGPNLDVLLGTGTASPDTIKANKTRVLAAINDGLNGRMPAGLVGSQQADQIADFVANNVDYLPGGGTTSGGTSTTSSAGGG
jgi:mono/diheme cytochrome c family protein